VTLHSHSIDRFDEVVTCDSCVPFFEVLTLGRVAQLWIVWYLSRVERVLTLQYALKLLYGELKLVRVIEGALLWPKLTWDVLTSLL
jgi:hypothetical protein